MTWPAPTLNVSVAAPPDKRHALTAGRIPAASGLARAVEVAVAPHRMSVPAWANGAGKPPEAWAETATAPTASVARALASWCSMRLTARWAAVLGCDGGNPGS